MQLWGFHSQVIQFWNDLPNVPPLLKSMTSKPIKMLNGVSKRSPNTKGQFNTSCMTLWCLWAVVWTKNILFGKRIAARELW